MLICIQYHKTSHCGTWPYFWPMWTGGNKDFIKQGQPFDKLLELKLATMLEF